MISLDQVLVLEQKVESAVEKIQQLEAENAALRNKCSELTNALSAKSEQLTSFESEQNKIESGIIKAIDRLNSIENSVLKAAGQSVPAAKEAPVKATGLAAAAAKVTEEEPDYNPPNMNFDTMDVVEPGKVEVPVEESIQDTIEEPIEEPVEDPVEDTIEEPVEDAEAEDPENRDELGFDIF